MKGKGSPPLGSKHGKGGKMHKGLTRKAPADKPHGHLMGKGMGGGGKAPKGRTA